MEKISAVFDWPGFEIREGAGLSRSNRISISQMIELLREFQPWKDLLYSDIQGIQAKTGTLKGISSYTGYLEKAGEITPFALFIERNVSFDFRKRVARELLDTLATPGARYSFGPSKTMAADGSRPSSSTSQGINLR